MKLYYAETLMPRKACAVARHLGSPVEFVRVDLQKGEQRTPEYAALNPNLKVPVLVHDGGSLWESNAIMCFLARAAGSDLWPGDGDRQVEAMRWLCWDLMHFTRYTGELYFEHVIKADFGIGEPDPAAVEEAMGYVRKYARILDDHLKGRRFLVGDGLTVADFAVAIALPYAARARIPLADYPEVARWHARLEELPAWREPFPAVDAAA
ncbi:MAG: glutathione S-transferase family protein [Thalassobaculum sp.]|uniref:glutathione S-transferase family protein n=1 Tax=Thalassobaculum sp. TaxID=2022740 RepID=UPI0032ED0622